MVFQYLLDFFRQVFFYFIKKANSNRKNYDIVLKQVLRPTGKNAHNPDSHAVSWSF